MKGSLGIPVLELPPGMSDGPAFLAVDRHVRQHEQIASPRVFRLLVGTVQLTPQNASEHLYHAPSVEVTVVKSFDPDEALVRELRGNVLTFRTNTLRASGDNFTISFFWLDRVADRLRDQPITKETLPIVLEHTQIRLTCCVRPRDDPSLWWDILIGRSGDPPPYLPPASPVTSLDVLMTLEIMRAMRGFSVDGRYSALTSAEADVRIEAQWNRQDLAVTRLADPGDPAQTIIRFVRPNGYFQHTCFVVEWPDSDEEFAETNINFFRDCLDHRTWRFFVEQNVDQPGLPRHSPVQYELAGKRLVLYFFEVILPSLEDMTL